MRSLSLSSSALLFLSLTGLAQAQTTPTTTADKPATARPGVQLRIDSVGSHSKEGSTPTKYSQGFQVTTARLGVSGDLSETLSYTLRLSLKSAANFSADRNSPDGAPAALDRAYIEHRPIKALAIRIGRLPMASLSIENDYSSIDQYYYSYLNDAVSRVAPITSGVDLSYTFGASTLSLQGFNGFYDGVVEKKGVQRGENLSTALAFRSNLANGLFKPIVTYDRFSRIRNGEGATRDEKATYTAYGVGTQISAAGADFDIEYDGMTKPKFTSYNVDPATKASVEVKNQETKITSVVSQLAYNLNDLGLRPFVKGSSDLEKVDGKDSVKSQRGALGVEWKPGTKGLRYHAVAVDSHDDAFKYDAAGAKVKTRTNARQYIVGIVSKM